MTDDELRRLLRQRMTEGENRFWRFALPRVDLITVVCAGFTLFMGALMVVLHIWWAAALDFALFGLDLRLTARRMRHEAKTVALLRQWLDEPGGGPTTDV